MHVGKDMVTSQRGQFCAPALGPESLATQEEACTAHGEVGHAAQGSVWGHMGTSRSNVGGSSGEGVCTDGCKPAL